MPGPNSIVVQTLDHNGVEIDRAEGYVEYAPPGTGDEETLKLTMPTRMVNDKTFTLKAEIVDGIGRVAWDFRFDPPAASISALVSNVKRQLDPALKRTDLPADKMDILKKAQADLDKWGTNYRKIQEIQRAVFAVVQPGRGMFGGGGMRGGPMGGQMAEPGTYAVKLTVGDKTYTGKVVVRLDPIQTAK